MRKVIVIDDKETGFACSAFTPRLYRAKFARDIIRDLNTIEKSLKKAIEAKNAKTATDLSPEEQLSAIDLEIFENIAYTMAKEYDLKNVEDDPDEWLMNFNVFSIYEILPQLLVMWQMNQKTTAIPAKK